MCRLHGDVRALDGCTIRADRRARAARFYGDQADWKTDERTDGADRYESACRSTGT